MFIIPAAEARGRTQEVSAGAEPDIEFFPIYYDLVPGPTEREINLIVFQRGNSLVRVRRTFCIVIIGRGGSYYYTTRRS